MDSFYQELSSIILIHLNNIQNIIFEKSMPTSVGCCGNIVWGSVFWTPGTLWRTGNLIVVGEICFIFSGIVFSTRVFVVLIGCGCGCDCGCDCGCGCCCCCCDCDWACAGCCCCRCCCCCCRCCCCCCRCCCEFWLDRGAGAIWRIWRTRVCVASRRALAECVCSWSRLAKSLITVIWRVLKINGSFINLIFRIVSCIYASEMKSFHIHFLENL